MAFDLKKFLASGKPPTEAIARGGSRPKGSPEPTVIKGPKDKKKKVVKKSNQFSKAVKKSQTKAKVEKKAAKEKKARNRTNFSSKNIILGSNMIKSGVLGRKVNPKKSNPDNFYDDLKKATTVKAGKDLAKKYADSITFKVPVFMKNNQPKAAVTKEELQSFRDKKGNQELELRDYLNEKAGLTRRRFGGIAIKGVKDPNKIFKG